MVGAVFFSEGVQKFLFPETLGVGRFTKIGIPLPGLMAPFVGLVEIVCGALLIFGPRKGKRSKLAAIPLLINITVAILTTKVPILFHQGFWSMVHEARTDFCMVMGICFILLG